jgi:hypothetical protein
VTIPQINRVGSLFLVSTNSYTILKVDLASVMLHALQLDAIPYTSLATLKASWYQQMCGCSHSADTAPAGAYAIIVCFYICPQNQLPCDHASVTTAAVYISTWCISIPI